MPQAQDISDRGGTVLHVEDNSASRFARRRTLESAGFRVVEATTVAGAWDAVLRERPDVVLTDVKLPDGNGYELTRHIKGNLALATTRVFQVSAVFTDCEHRVKGLDSGADAYSTSSNRRRRRSSSRSSARWCAGAGPEELVTTLLDGAPMLIAGADATGRVAIFNAASEALTGRSRAEVIGRPAIETLVAPADRDAVARRLQEASPAELAVPYENRWLTATGDDMLIEWRCFQVAAPDGGHWTLGIGHDVTERRRTEAAAHSSEAQLSAALEELRRSEHRLRTIIDNTTTVIYMLDPDDRFLLINRRFADLFGIDRSAIAGRSLYDCFPHDVAAAFAANNAEVWQTGAACEFEERVPQSDGLHTYLSVKAPLYDDAGAPYAVCGLSTDVTEMKRLTDALQAADREKDSFIASVAHELRQPLGAIQAALALMQRRVSREKGEQARAVVARQVAQLSRLIEDLLDVSRITRGNITLRRQHINLNDIIEAAVSVAQPAIDERRHHLEVLVPPDALEVEADAVRLQQVFSNVLMNAAKFTEEGGRITVAVERDDAFASVRVRDTGRGIAADALPHIFDLFSQAVADERGLGLGLAIARGLVERHGGTIEARSNGLGHGSEFTIRLPLAEGRL